MNIERIVKDLKKSPLFQLSLSSKELFHSNFIYWLISTYTAEFSGLFSRFLTERDNQKITNVTRENNQNGHCNIL